MKWKPTCVSLVPIIKKYYDDLTLVWETSELASRDEESNKFGGIRNSHICWEWSWRKADGWNNSEVPWPTCVAFYMSNGGNKLLSLFNVDFVRWFLLGLSRAYYQHVDQSVKEKKGRVQLQACIGQVTVGEVIFFYWVSVDSRFCAAAATMMIASVGWVVEWNVFNISARKARVCFLIYFELL